MAALHRTPTSNQHHPSFRVVSHGKPSAAFLQDVLLTNTPRCLKCVLLIYSRSHIIQVMLCQRFGTHGAPKEEIVLKYLRGDFNPVAQIFVKLDHFPGETFYIL